MPGVHHEDQPSLEDWIFEELIDVSTFRVGVTVEQVEAALFDQPVYGEVVEMYIDAGADICPDPHGDASIALSYAAPLVWDRITAVHQEQGT